MQKRVSIGDLARAAGVNHSTASRALSNHPHIAEETRARILALADELGYRPEPALSAMARDRWLGRTKGGGSVLAYVCVDAALARTERHLKGAMRAAARLGYRLEVFDRATYPDDAALARTLLMRGINGLLLRVARPGWGNFTLPWEKFAAVLVSRPPDQAPWVDGAVSDTFGLHRRAMGEVLARGYERPGLVLLEPRFMADEVLRIGGVSAAWSERGREGAPPILWVPGNDSAVCRRLLRAWLAEQRIDCVLGQTDLIAHELRALGRKIPGRLGYVSLAEGALNSGLSRVLPDLEGVGETAVAMLAARLHQRVYGLPAKPVLTQVDGAWFEGTSLAKPAARHA